MKIYTKTGDNGTSSLYSGGRRPKDDPTFEALGAIDETNAAIGTTLSALPDYSELQPLRGQLITIQHALFDLGAAVATPLDSAKELAKKKTRFDASGTGLLERWIDQLTEQLPSLKNFILPGGHLAGALLHMARGSCRRAERCAIPLAREGHITDDVSIYLNRLSDYLFQASRSINQVLSTPEEEWEPHRTPEES